jgi:hypothetical protein
MFGTLPYVLTTQWEFTLCCLQSQMGQVEWQGVGYSAESWRMDFLGSVGFLSYSFLQ